jgi:hypothetical protein
VRGSPAKEIKITLTNGDEEKRLTDALKETQVERQRKDAARRKRLQRAREASHKSEVRNARDQLKRLFPELLEIIISEEAPVKATWDSREIREIEDELIISGLREYLAWEQSLAAQPKSDN